MVTGPGAGRGFRGEAASLLAAIGAVRRTVRREARYASVAEPLPIAQGELLRLIGHQPGICVAEAAQELRLAANTISTLVGQLTGQGLLRRERARPDGRSIRLTLTARGQEHIEHWRDLRADLVGQAMARLDAGDRVHLTEAVPALTRLAERMQTP